MRGGGEGVAAFSEGQRPALLEGGCAHSVTGF